MERRALNQTEIESAQTELPGWEIFDGKFRKVFKFRSFAEALGWMVSIGVYADKINHHPDWSNSYSKVTVELITHDLNAISTLDVALAKRMEKLANTASE